MGKPKPVEDGAKQKPLLRLVSETEEQVRDVSPPPGFLDKLPELLRLEEVRTLFGIAPATVYNWKYRQKQLGVPSGLFLKFNRKLFIRTEVLKRWIASQNPSGF
ncbi:MAG: hypothetical protein JST16_18615 [Bdellovibrionales bacterium]|nr:hypothetical protein [Bdellovibrionales bacterium]